MSSTGSNYPDAVVTLAVGANDLVLGTATNDLVVGVAGFSNKVHVGPGVSVYGPANAATLVVGSNLATVNAALAVSGPGTFCNGVTVSGTLNVATINYCNVFSNVIVYNSEQIASNFYVGGTATFSCNAFLVQGPATLSNVVTFASNLTASGAASMCNVTLSNLTASGATALCNVTLCNLTATGSVSLCNATLSNLTATGTVSLCNATLSNLTSTGAATLCNALTVLGASVLSNAATLYGNLTVLQGATVLGQTSVSNAIVRTLPSIAAACNPAAPSRQLLMSALDGPGASLAFRGQTTLSGFASPASWAPLRSNATDVDAACGVSHGTFCAVTSSNGLRQAFCANNATFARVTGALSVDSNAGTSTLLVTVESLSNASDYSNLTVDWLLCATRRAIGSNLPPWPAALAVWLTSDHVLAEL